MKRIVGIGCLGLSLVAGVAFGDSSLTDSAVAGVASRFSAAIKCGPGSRDVQRAWCPVAAVDHTAFKAAPPGTLLGLSVELPTGGDVNAQLLATTSVSALHLGNGTARLTWLKPSNEQEKKDMLPVLIDIAGALKSGGKSIGVTKDLSDYLASERAKPQHPLRAVGKAMEYMATLPSRLYRVGNAFVAIETTNTGYFVSVFPIVPLVVK